MQLKKIQLIFINLSNGKDTNKNYLINACYLKRFFKYSIVKIVFIRFFLINSYL